MAAPTSTARASAKSLTLDADSARPDRSAASIKSAPGAAGAQIPAPPFPPLGSRGLRGAKLDWRSPRGLLEGDLSLLEPYWANQIQRAAARPETVAVAAGLGLKPVVLVLALIARAQPFTNRTARRLAKAVLGANASAELRELARTLDLG